jgi:putative transposase
VKKACALLDVARATHYRRRQPARLNQPPAPRGKPANALSELERHSVLALLHQAPHCDLAVAQVYARTLDAGTYLASQSTMHRILRAQGESQDRRDQRTHPAKKIPELMAGQPNEVWSWDITKLKGPSKGISFNLYVVLDIFSRYVVNWLLAAHEDMDLAKEFLEDAIIIQGVSRHQLTIHADRGGAMRSKPVSQLLVDLGVVRSHSRPHVSNDNPYSESQFKTMKYCPAFPARFDSIEQARGFCVDFFAHYNHVHRHSGIALHTPASVHFGTHVEVRAQRQATLEAAYAANPGRFRNRTPIAPQLPESVWINQPKREELAQIF